MTDHSPSDAPSTGAPPPPPDVENPALLDAQKTFLITLISAILFCGAALAIILRTRMG